MDIDKDIDIDKVNDIRTVDIDIDIDIVIGFGKAVRSTKLNKIKRKQRYLYFLSSLSG